MCCFYKTFFLILNDEKKLLKDFEIENVRPLLRMEFIEYPVYCNFKCN